ncbi:Cell division protein FtsL [bioreactor metagenome]|uniref:Cell division protein FtsL n=1 Tax=bioreactor metagenome TaxID=1076179 RepID=A0A645D6T8_9ZZZZ|nr:hypothetical protein [Candidatus Pelethousia sp.]NCB29951.1 hypothetical protein [Clostridia bacterium]
MAVAAKKSDDSVRYAPGTRIYSRGAAAPALEIEKEKQPHAAPKRQQGAAAQITRVAKDACPRPKVSAGRLLLVTLGILASAALLLITLVRYAMISQEYAVVNETKTQIETYQREIAALNVQLNAAVSLEKARAAALAAGMGYPTAEQIVRLQGEDQAQTGGQTAPE